MRRTHFLVVLLGILPIRLFEIHLTAQTSGNVLPYAEEANEDNTEEPILRGAMILRISERYLEELFAREFDKRSPVTRTVLGTVAKGSAHTKGRTEVDIKPDHDDAAFEIRIIGTTSSRTVGRNGSAIIHSYAVTEWNCRKLVRFEGKKFVTLPAVIESETSIRPLGADSSLSGLRGRIVRLVASRRAAEQNSAAEHVVNRDTQGRVKADVDRVIEERILSLNQNVEGRSLIGTLLPRLADAGAKFSTSSTCVNIIFGGDPSSKLAEVCPAQHSPTSDTEVWIHTALITGPEQGVPGVLKDARRWVVAKVPDVAIPGLDLMSSLRALPVGIDMVDDWIVVRSSTPTFAVERTMKKSASPE